MARRAVVEARGEAPAAVSTGSVVREGMVSVTEELLRRAERHEEEAERNYRHIAASTGIDPLSDSWAGANTAAASAYREAAELVKRSAAPSRKPSAHEIILRNENGY